MPSHTDTKPSKNKLAPACMQEWHAKSNSEVDGLANDAAAFHTIPTYKAKPIIDLLKNLTLVQNIFIAVVKLYSHTLHNAPIAYNA